MTIPVTTNPPGYNREGINDFPRLHMARSGPFRGEVYVVFHYTSASVAEPRKSWGYTARLPV